MSTTNGSQKQLEDLVDEILLSNQEKTVYSLFNAVARRAEHDGIPFDGSAILEYFWKLARIGIVAIPGESISIPRVEVPKLLLTNRGRLLLQEREQSPHNSNKYIAAVKARVGQPDDIVISYLEEAVGAWEVGLNRSSAVMLGCACEKLVLLLAEKISKANLNPWSQALENKLLSRASISNMFDEVRKCLLDLRDKKKLPKDCGDALDRKLSAIFDHARALRNQSGHPSGIDVSANDAEAGLLLFPGFFQLVDRLIAHI